MARVEKKRIGILTHSYAAATGLAAALAQVPADDRPDIEELFVSDDHGQSMPELTVATCPQSSGPPIITFLDPRTVSYGGHQKDAFNLAIEHELDIVVVLPGAGDHAPESLACLLAPLVSGDADVVFGSRTVSKKPAHRSGLPTVRSVGNRLVTQFQNAALGMHLTDFQSGSRGFSVHALMRIPFERNSDGFGFDTQLMIQLNDAGFHIAEMSVPDDSGDGIRGADWLRVVAGALEDVVAYRLQKAGFGDGSRVALNEEYQLKPSEDSSHGRILEMLSARPPCTVLDLGCSSGLLAERLGRMGHHVVGVDMTEIAGVRDRTSAFFKADLNQGIPADVGSGFDVVLAADVIEHLANPVALLRQARELVAPGGTAIFCVPNFAHWYPRLRSAMGRFDYDQRGILDATHLRFFTRRSVRKLVEGQGFTVRGVGVVGLPLDALDMGGATARAVRVVDSVLLSLSPNLFGYQIIVEATPNPRSARSRPSSDPVVVRSPSGRRRPDL